MNSRITRRTTCRLCNGSSLDLAVSIKPSPIADAYVTASSLGEEQELYPLDLYFCRDCGHVQNVDIVDPEVLFREYRFTTTSSLNLKKHFDQYADDIVKAHSLLSHSLVVEIGSNDGTLLRRFKEHGMKVIGVDPAREIAKSATESGIPTIADFFTKELAINIVNQFGKAKIVAANNVFAHSDDLRGMVCGIYELLSDDGIFVFEVSYLVDIVDKYLFDTVYHEHVSYHSIAPLDQFLNRNGLELFDIAKIKTKGGSIRGFAQRKGSGGRGISPIVKDIIAEEKLRGFQTLETYHNYQQRIAVRRNDLRALLDEAIDSGKRIAGYGASTTTNTLIWDFGLIEKLDFVVDDNPSKIGLYFPACHIPILASEQLYVRRPDYVVILAWQYTEAIVARHKRYIDEGGIFVIPLTELQILKRG